MTTTDLLVSISVGFVLVALPFVAIATITMLGLAAGRVWHLCGGAAYANVWRVPRKMDPSESLPQRQSIRRKSG